MPLLTATEAAKAEPSFEPIDFLVSLRRMGSLIAGMWGGDLPSFKC